MGYDAHLNLHKMEENKTLIYPAIVVATYNRPNALHRLLGSIARADYTGYENIPLVISIDGGGDPECRQIAEMFTWNYGEKRIIAHDFNMGLKKHILSCGDLTEQYGAIIMLEEDVYVSPYFYDYSVQTTSYYQPESKIAGISLYFLKNHDLIGTPFWPLASGCDVFFAQVPSSWGQVWTSGQWKSFKEWMKKNDNREVSQKLPVGVRNVWPNESSWKKFFYSYMVENSLFFVFPYVAYATNMGDKGEHFSEATFMFQTCIMEYPSSLCLRPFEEINVKYDAYFELLPEVFRSREIFAEYDFEVDLSGAKPLGEIESPYLLSIKPCRNPIFSFGMNLSPIEVNVLEQQIGNMISFGRKEDFDKQRDESSYEQLMRINNEMVYQISKYYGYKEGVMQENKRMKQTKYYRLGYMLLTPFRLFSHYFLKDND